MDLRKERKGRGLIRGSHRDRKACVKTASPIRRLCLGQQTRTATSTISGRPHHSIRRTRRFSRPAGKVQRCSVRHRRMTSVRRRSLATNLLPLARWSDGNSNRRFRSNMKSRIVRSLELRSQEDAQPPDSDTVLEVRYVRQPIGAAPWAAVNLQ